MPIYPNLSQLARKILAVPATSAPIERVFSHAGNILRPDRSRLKPKHKLKKCFFETKAPTLLIKLLTYENLI